MRGFSPESVPEPKPSVGFCKKTMNQATLRDCFGQRYATQWITVDSHTLGEATRLILHGCGEIPGATMREKREYFQGNLDHVRRLLTCEPRGHRDLLAAAVTPPTTPGAHFGLIYMDARRYPFLCGHATIGAVTTLVELGLISAAEEIVVDTPSGPMPTRVFMKGDRVAAVAMRSVPTFVYGKGESLNVPGLGTVTADTVCVGGYFVMIDADKAGLDFSPANRSALIPLGMRVIEEANRQLTVRHPERPEVNTIDVVEFYREPESGKGESVVIYGESHMDRCPCGTGTTAKAALLHSKGRLAPGEQYVNAGPLGTTFTAEIVEETTVGDLPAVRVEVCGSATITGFHSFVLDEADPFPGGFLI